MMGFKKISYYLILIFLVHLLSLTESAPGSDYYHISGCDLTMDGNLGSIRDWFWSSSSASSNPGDCVYAFECYYDGKCTLKDWVAPAILTAIFMAIITFVLAFIFYCLINFGAWRKGVGVQNRV